MSDTTRDPENVPNVDSGADKHEAPAPGATLAPRKPRKRKVTPLRVEIGRLSVERKLAGKKPLPARKVVTEAGGSDWTGRNPGMNGVQPYQCERDYLSTLPPESPTLRSLAEKSMVRLEERIAEPGASDLLLLTVVKLDKEHADEGTEQQLPVESTSDRLSRELTHLHALAVGIELALRGPDAARALLARLSGRLADLRERVSTAREYARVGVKVPRSEQRRRNGLSPTEAED